MVSRDSKVHNSASSLFILFLWGLVVLPILGDPYLNTQDKFVRFILKDRYLVIHIPFVRVVKFKILAQFPVDHLAHPVLSSLILFLC